MFSAANHLIAGSALIPVAGRRRLRGRCSIAACT
jgi:hypothetical protein